MKTYQLIGLIGILILIICGFLPLAYLSDDVITIVPIFNNFDIAESMWIWKDVSAFAFTYGITVLLCGYLLVKNYKPGYFISASLNIVVFLFIYFSIWLASVKVEEFGNVTFSYSAYGLLLVLGYALLFFAGAKIEKKK